MADRELDVILFGATGFVGRLTAQHLAEHAPDGTRIGLAGRSATKVEQVRAELGERAADWPVVVADAADPDQLADLVLRTRVVISTVGPYARHGLPLVRACAEHGTDYVDLTGEVLFVRASIDAVDDVARRSGARIVHSCGFDSVPSDLAVLLAAGQAATDGAGELTETTGFFRYQGGLSGGTIDSMRHQVRQAREDPGARDILADPESLSGPQALAAGTTSDTERDSFRVRQDRAVGTWSAPFVMAAFNTRVVRRSNALLGHRYGRGLRYREVLATGPGPRGMARAYATLARLGAVLGLMGTPALGKVADRVVPAPGEGPDEQQRAAGWFSLDCRATTTSGRRYRSTVAAKGDPGYSATAVMLGQSALALALQRDECPLPPGREGGVLTPATALGEVLADRLVAHGFTCEVTADGS